MKLLFELKQIETENTNETYQTKWRAIKSEVVNVIRQQNKISPEENSI